jgi:Fe-S cluster assembly iron-binding protein IscA
MNVTREAASEFKRMLESRSLPTSTRVRVGVEPVAGETTLRLFVAFEDQPAAGDEDVVTSEGVEVVMDKHLRHYMGEVSIDFVQSAGQGSFVLRRVEEAARPR